MINIETIKQSFIELSLQAQEFIGHLSGRVVHYLYALSSDLQNNKYEVAVLAGTSLTSFLIADQIAKIIDRKFFNFDGKLTRTELITKHTFINLMAGSLILASNYLAASLLGYSLNLGTCAAILVVAASIRAIFDRLIRKRPGPIQRGIRDINSARTQRNERTPQELAIAATKKQSMLRAVQERLKQARMNRQQVAQLSALSLNSQSI